MDSLSERQAREIAGDDAMLRTVVRVLRLAASKGVTNDELERLHASVTAYQRAKKRMS